MTIQDAQNNLQALIDRGFKFGSFYNSSSELMAFQAALNILSETANKITNVGNKDTE